MVWLRVADACPHRHLGRIMHMMNVDVFPDGTPSGSSKVVQPAESGKRQKRSREDHTRQQIDSHSLVRAHHPPPCRLIFWILVSAWWDFVLGLSEPSDVCGWTSLSVSSFASPWRERQTVITSVGRSLLSAASLFHPYITHPLFVQPK